MDESHFPAFGDIATDIAGSPVVLLPERALYLPGHDTLIVADVHLGKEGAFRAAGVSTPDGPGMEALERLGRALARSAAGRLIFAGDLFHNTDALSSAGPLFLAWRGRHPELRIQLTPAGHDRWAGALPDTWRVDGTSQTLELPPFLVQHYPEASDAGYVLCGHLHPGLRLSEHRGTGISLPCFHFGEKMGVLPAFGNFTGLAHATPQSGDRIFAVAEDKVLEVPLP